MLRPLSILIFLLQFCSVLATPRRNDRYRGTGGHNVIAEMLEYFGLGDRLKFINFDRRLAPRSEPQSTSTTTVQVTVTSTTIETLGTSVTVPDHATLTQGPSTSVTTVVVSLETTLTISQVQSATVTPSPTVTGTVVTTIPRAGNPSVQPFNTTVYPSPSRDIFPITNGPEIILASTTTSKKTKTKPTMSSNIFQPIASAAPPPQIPSRGDHPVPRAGIVKTGPIATNKFYANFFLGNRNQSTWTHPYSVSWNSGSGPTGSWGLAVSHVTRDKTVYGPGSPAAYFINPLGIQSVVISAKELGRTTALSLADLKSFSCNVNLAATTNGKPVITFPVVQGMGFVTAIFTAGTISLQSTSAFTSLTYGGVVDSPTVRYTVTLNDGTTWLMYITPANGGKAPLLTLAGAQQIIANYAFTGTLQVAKIPDGLTLGTAQPVYDKSAGVYASSGSIMASVSGTQGTYSLSWTKAGRTTKTLLMWALPHHVSSFATQTRSSLQNGFKLQTTTKGLASAVLADYWSLQETLPTDILFAPWSPALGSQPKLSAKVKKLMNKVAANELNEDIAAQTNLNSMYFAGKGLAKFATIVYATNTLGGATGAASAGLVQLKQQFSRFVNNSQIFPLAYDSAWGGLVSSAAYVTGDPNTDFGNTYYNDHHFHYGYFVYTAAVIGFLDPTWLNEGTNKAWVNTLVRDFANPASDGYFPFSRSFDWYHGHSWAKGLFESFDGKDQESSSEDAFASYAIKMWGRTIGDANMQARGNLQLAIQARTFNLYYYMQSNNVIQPPRFVPNKAAGILFENKIDHTTYFGGNIEFVEGIHMLPLNPSSAYTRNKTFVQQEWDMYFSKGRVDSIQGGWRGILYANLAIIDPQTAYKFFAQANFDNAWLDSGASRTWYLAYSAGLGGAP